MESVCVNSGDTAWMLISTALVLAMIPALAFFESGLAPARYAHTITAQVFLGMALMGLTWWSFGFSLVFSPSFSGIIGGLEYSFFLELEQKCLSMAPKIPAVLYAMFQLMFASITPLLLTGAYIGRLSIGGFLFFAFTWEVAVYFPIAHSIWNPEGLLHRLGVLDYAGGIVIHTSAGAASIVGVLVLGNRKEFLKKAEPHNSIVAAGVGAALLMLGWFGFNAGSAESAGAIAASTLASTMLASCTGMLTWSVLSMVIHKETELEDLFNGAIVGLAGITPASGFIYAYASVPITVIFSSASFFSAHFIRDRLKIDDTLEVSSVHGLCGALGALANAFCANAGRGLFYGGGGRLIWVQLVGIFVTIVWSSVWTFVILKGVKCVPIFLAPPDGIKFSASSIHDESESEF